MVRRILAVATAGLVSACTVGPTYRAPEITMPDRYALVAPVRAPSQSDVNWWLAFNDRVLDEMIRHIFIAIDPASDLFINRSEAVTAGGCLSLQLVRFAAKYGKFVPLFMKLGP